jgi:hypothetical protein
MNTPKEEFLAEILTEGALWISGVGTPKPADETFDDVFPSRAEGGWLAIEGGVAVEGMTGNERFAQLYAVRDADGYIQELRIKFDVVSPE